MNIVEQLLGRTLDITKVLGAIAIFLMMAHITLDVVARFVVLKPLPGTLVFVSRYYMVIVAFLSLAVTERHAQHISVEVVSERMPERVQGGLNVMGALLSAIIFGMLAWRGFEEGIKKYEVGAFVLESNVAIPVWPTYFLLTFGAALMSLTLIFKIIRHLSGGVETRVTHPF